MCLTQSKSATPLFFFGKRRGGKMFHLPFFSDGNRPNPPPPHSYLGGGRKREKRKWGKNKHVLPSLYPLFFSSFFLSPGEIYNFGKIDSPKKPPAAGKRKEKETFLLSFSPFRGSLVSAAKEGKNKLFFFAGQKIIFDNGRRDVDGNSFSEAQVMAQSHIWLWKEERGKKDGVWGRGCGGGGETAVWQVVVPHPFSPLCFAAQDLPIFLEHLSRNRGPKMFYWKYWPVRTTLLNTGTRKVRVKPHIWRAGNHYSRISPPPGECPLSSSLVCHFVGGVLPPFPLLS